MTRLFVSSPLVLRATRALARDGSIAAILLLLSAFLSACTESSTLVSQDETVDSIRVTASLQVMEGADQDGVVASLLPAPLVARVTDAEGAPLEGVSVEWRFGTGRGRALGTDGELQEVVVQSSGADGRAAVEWELGSGAGAQEGSVEISEDSGSLGVAARSGADRAAFTANARPGAAANLDVTPAEAVLMPEDTIRFSVAARDEYENPIPEPAVQWASSDAEVLEVDAGGLVRAVSTGTASVSARVGAVDASAAAQVVSPGAAELILESGRDQSAVVAEPLSDPLVVRVLDPQGVGVEGVAVTWAVSSGDGVFGQSTTATDAQGRAQNSWTLGTRAGVQTARAEVPGLPGISVSATASAGPLAELALSTTSASLGPGETLQLGVSGSDAYGNAVAPSEVLWFSGSPEVATVSESGLVTGHAAGSAAVQAAQGSVSAFAEIQVTAVIQTPGTLGAVSGDGQAGAVGTTLPEALRVRLLDTEGQPMAGRVVEWTVVSGGGALSFAASTTDADGFASVEWTLGSAVGPQSARATTAGLDPLTFSAQALAGPLAAILVSPSDAALEVGQRVQLSAAGSDAYGNAVSLDGLTWSSSNPAMATVSVSGEVSAVGAGEVEVRATLDGVSGESTVTVTETAQVPGALQLTAGANQIGTVGQPLGLPLEVRLLDQEGNPMEGSAISWSVVAGGGDLSMVEGSTDTDGRSRANWTMGPDAGVQRVRASTDGVAPVEIEATAEAGALAVIQLDPGQATVQVGASAQFTAAGEDAFGNGVSLAGLTWSVLDPSVASVSVAGLVTGTAPGGTSVRAQQDGVAATANVTVEAVSSRVVFFQEDFEDASFGGRGWYDNTGMQITSSESQVGASALELRFNAGQQLPTSGGASRRIFTESESVYVRFWVKYSDNWVGSGVGYHPHDFQIITNEDGIWAAPSNTRLTAYIETNYDGGIRPVMGMRDRRNIDGGNAFTDLTGVTEDRAAAGCNGEGDRYPTGCWNQGGSWWNEKFWTADAPAFSDSPGPRYKNDWHLVEVYFQLNSIQNGIGVADGIARYWVDGEVVMDMADILFRTGARPDMRFNQFLIAPYIGVGSPVTQTMWIDDLVVADRR